MKNSKNIGVFLSKKIIRLITLLVALCIVTFVLMELSPIDPVTAYVGASTKVSAAQRELIAEHWGLNQPPVERFMCWFKSIIQGDWGTSLKMHINVPVWDIIKTKIPVTLYINFFALLISLPLGIAFGIVAAIRKNTITDYLISFMVVIFISVPSFIFATLLQYFIAFRAGWFPIIFDATSTGIEKFRGLALPILALSLGPIARVTRNLRAELAETINSDFMLLAKTKGLTERQATINHGIRNSMLPLMNIIVPMFTGIMGGSLVIETIFSIPGMGGIMVKSINAPDYTVTLAALIFYSLISLITVLIVDLSYGIIDPRVRMGGKK